MTELNGKPTTEELIVFAQDSYQIMGACFEVYKDKGAGFLEAVYQECLAIEFEKRNIPFASQACVELSYSGRILKQTYKADFICYGKIIVEIKAVSTLSNELRTQVINYLRATNMKLGLLINFGHFPKLEYERIVL